MAVLRSSKEEHLSVKRQSITESIEEELAYAMSLLESKREMLDPRSRVHKPPYSPSATGHWDELTGNSKARR